MSDQIDSARELIGEFGAKYPVTTAFWANPSDSALWYLYLVSPKIDDTNFDRAYSYLLSLFRNRSFGLIDPFQVRVLGEKDEVAVSAAKIRDRFSAPLPTRLGNTSIGILEVNGAYIYPPAAAATPTQ